MEISFILGLMQDYFTAQKNIHNHGFCEEIQFFSITICKFCVKLLANPVSTSRYNLMKLLHKNLAISVHTSVKPPKDRG